MTVAPIENKTLVLDLVEWLAAGPRDYAEVMDAWRTSCPRLPVWEDALDHGLVAVRREGALAGRSDGIWPRVPGCGAGAVRTWRDGAEPGPPDAPAILS